MLLSKEGKWCTLVLYVLEITVVYDVGEKGGLEIACRLPHVQSRWIVDEDDGFEDGAWKLSEFRCLEISFLFLNVKLVKFSPETV